MSDRPANGSGNVEPSSADLEAATRRLMAALESLESAVERRRDADRDEDELASRIQALGGRFGEIGDARLTVMAALTVCDELLDAGQRIRNLEEELEALRNVRSAAADRARTTQTAVANALNAAADRIERTAQVLNRTIGGGVAIG